jgi:hypothetical protein
MMLHEMMLHEMMLHEMMLKGVAPPRAGPIALNDKTTANLSLRRLARKKPDLMLRDLPHSMHATSGKEDRTSGVVTRRGQRD